MTVAPSAKAAATISLRKDRSLRVASSALNSTSGVWSLARRTASRAMASTSPRFFLSLWSMWMSEVAMKVWMRGRAASRMASQARSMSAGMVRHRAATMGSRTSRATICTPAKSSWLATGNPASMADTFRAASWWARRSFSEGCMEQPGLCSPSRRVVSKMWMGTDSSCMAGSLEVEVTVGPGKCRGVHPYWPFLQIHKRPQWNCASQAAGPRPHNGSRRRRSCCTWWSP